jgi:peptide/nickel transport system substrate-binding protein
MSLTLRARGIRTVAALGLVGALLAPAAPAAAQESVVLRVGQTQSLESVNPYETILVIGYEVYQLTYNLLVDFGPELEPVPGYAESWERSADGQSWVFTIREGMTWSDGEPATSADACFSWQLAIDAIANEGSLGAGYLEPGLTDAGVTRVECPDETTMIAYTEDGSNRVLQTYLPIIPQHIWGEETWETIGDAEFTPPQVGTGPYILQDWEIGQFTQFTRNETYWGEQGYADEIVIQEYSTSDPMVAALRANELDYVRGVNPQQMTALGSEAAIETVVGESNGWTQLAFNTYGTGTGNTIEGGGASTAALQDQAFRDALGYAVDREVLVERVLGGYGSVGNTIIPPVITEYHVEPTTPRTFDLEEAKRRLDAAGYPLDGQGRRLDKEGQPINLRLVMPEDETYQGAAQFVVDWYGELGVGVSPQVLDEATLTELILPPEGDGTADYDIELWGWSWGPDPSGALYVFTCDAIGTSSDSLYCNPEYDAMYEAQNAETDPAERQAIIVDMQNLIYDEAVYDILFYDAELHAYRTDRFGDWRKIPASNGTPLFTYGTLDYTYLTEAAAAPSPSPAASGDQPAPAPSAGPSASPADGGSAGGGGMNPALIVGIVAALAVVVGGLVLVTRRRAAGATDEDE